jgi:hypothetical protein
MTREEGHYSIKRVRRLPSGGNANLLYAIIDDKIDTLYRWLPNGTYEPITIGGGSTITNTSQLINDGENGVDPFITLNDLVNLTPTGLEALDEGNGVGWRLIGRDPADYGNIGFNAVDFSTNSASYLSKVGGVGASSVTFGDHVENRGVACFGNGFNNLITSAGFSYASLLSGTNNEADGSLGSLTVGTTLVNRNAWGCTVLGVANEIITGGGGVLNPSGIAPLLIIGNGTQANSFDINGNFLGYEAVVRSNAFVVRRSGELTAPSMEPSVIDGETTGKVLITKEYLNERIQRVKVSLTPSQIQNLGTTPVELISAPGAGKVINILSVTSRVIFGTVAYNGTGGGLQISAVGGASFQATVNRFVINSPSDAIVKNTISDNGTNGQLVENAAVEASWSTGGATPTVGDSNIDIFLTYETITL